MDRACYKGALAHLKIAENGVMQDEDASFLDAPRISIRGCVRPSVRWSVGRSVGPSIGHAFVKKSKKVFVKCLKVENGHVGTSVVPAGTCSCTIRL